MVEYGMTGKPAVEQQISVCMNFLRILRILRNLQKFPAREYYQNTYLP